MLDISKLNEIQFLVFGLILLRMTSYVFSAAIFNSTVISSPLKVLLSLAFTMMVFNQVATAETVVRISEMQNEIILMSAYEVVMGLMLGFVTRLFFFAISMAGELISVSMGLGQAQIFNPMMGSQGNAVEQFLVMIAMLVFFAINGHHFLVQGLMQSFSIVPLAKLTVNAVEFKQVVFLGQQLMLMAVQMSAPIVISMLVVQIGIGLLSRAVPQINVLTTTLAVTIFLGMAIFIVSLPLIVHHMNSVLDLTAVNFFRFVKSI